MNKQDLIALAEMVEKAEGPDRGLDADIAIAIHYGGEYDIEPENVTSARKVLLSHGARPGDYEVSAFSGVSLRSSPRYTASLGAAMTLAPEGWDWSVSRVRGDGSFPPFSCNMTPEDQPYPVDSEIDTEARSAALALTAASLRAIAEEKKDA